MTGKPSASSNPFDRLARIAAAATFGERQAPVPAVYLDQLADAAEEAGEHLEARAAPLDVSMHDVEQILVHAALAVVAYPAAQPALQALRGASDLYDYLRPRPEADPSRWEERAGLMGGG